MSQPGLKGPLLERPGGSAPRRFDLAPMAKGLQRMTVIYALLSVALMFWRDQPVAKAAGAFMTGIALFIYGYFRPSHFEVSPEALTLVWLVRRRVIPRASILKAETLGTRDLGWMLRIGAGGVGGAFGSFYTSKRGFIDGYFTCMDGLVLLSLEGRRPLLLSPADPVAFQSALGLG